jgi:hypothetical protein
VDGPDISWSILTVERRGGNSEREQDSRNDSSDFIGIRKKDTGRACFALFVIPPFTTA